MVDFIGHRGHSSLYVENSKKALLDCSQNPNIDGAELDFRLTKDGILVVMHNNKLEGITKTGKGLIIDKTFKELQQYQFKTSNIDKLLQLFNTISLEDKDFFNSYLSVGKQSEPIATLDSILKDFSRDKKLLIEQKAKINEYSQTRQEYYEASLIELLIKNHYKQRNIVLEGYNKESVLRIKNKLPDIKTGALINRKGKINCLNMGFDFISCEFPLIDKYLIEELIKRNINLYSWDDKTPLEHYKYISNLLKQYSKEIENNQLNVTIINDFPEKAKEYIKIK